MEMTLRYDALNLRRFGLSTGAAFALLFGLLLPWLFSRSLPWWPWVIATPLWLFAVTAPKVLGPVYKVWMRFASLLAAINTTIILGVVFYTLITPFGLLMRLFGSGAIAQSSNDAASYRVPSRVSDTKSMERPF
jgi:Saxitoxin biosynthesis operon protein SxtJ